MLTRIGENNDGWTNALAALGAACLLALAIQVNDGTMHPVALRGLGFALALGLLAVFVPPLRSWQALTERVVWSCFVLALALQLHWWFTYEAGQRLLIVEPWRYAPMYLDLSMEALVAGLLLAGTQQLRPWFMALLLAIFVYLGSWLLRVTPTPAFDVWIFQIEGAKALVQGQNPFNITYTNPFGTEIYFPPGLATTERILFGFPYPPVSLYFAVLGYLFGDPRYAHFACTVLAAALMACGRKGRLAAAGTVLFLMTPRILEILQLAWTESTLVFLLALTVFCALRFPRAVPYAFGCLLVAKQYTFFLLLLAPLLTPLRGRALAGFLLRTLGTGLALTLPFVVINPSAFFFSVVKVHVLQPLRVESLSYAAWWVLQGHPPPPSWLTFVVAAVIALLCSWRAPRTPSGFAASVALVCCTFFALGKQAFVNYYYFSVAAFCISLAASDAEASNAGAESAQAPSSAHDQKQQSVPQAQSA